MNVKELLSKFESALQQLKVGSRVTFSQIRETYTTLDNPKVIQSS